MPTTHTWVTTELNAVSSKPDVEEIERKLMVAGYTKPVSGNCVTHRIDVDGDNIVIVVEETDVVKATLKSDLEAATIPTLTLDTQALQVAAYGLASGTITVTDTRGVGASGKTIRVRETGGRILFADAASKALDASGKATWTFGPTGQANLPAAMEFYYDTNEGPGVAASVEYTPA